MVFSLIKHNITFFQYCTVKNNDSALTMWITKTAENSEKDGNTRPPDVPPGKSVCRSRSNM